MNKSKEKNIKEFNKDVDHTGKYLYSDFDKYSAYIATKRQTDELIDIINTYFGKHISILDVGCGDGVFTLELYKAIKPKNIVGFDSASNAIQSANKNIACIDQKRISFQTVDVYEALKVFGKNKYDLVVVRGLLHHLYDPQKAIETLSGLANNIIVLEPSGFNPILKIIEKVSPYHRRHEEKSYWPPLLNKWFINNKFRIVDQRFFSIVPYFCPTPIAKLLKSIEPIMEKLPFVCKLYCGTNLIYYKK